MDSKEQKPEQDQAIAARIQALAKATKADPDPDGLEHLKKLIKKNVPFTLRGYFMAYLLRSALEGQKSGERKFREPRPGRNAAPVKTEGEEAKPAREEKPLPEGAKTLYLNIGKMKRLYAKELSQIIQDQIGVTRDDIYAIKIHDKYSFVSMSQENCEKAIAKMNGTDIKGRTVTVTYSNKD